MHLTGPVVDVGDVRSVDTRGGTTDLAEIRLRPEEGRREPVTVTLWGDWAETAEYLSSGMTLTVTDVDESEYRGTVQFGTTGASYVIVEPGYVATVTAVREWVQCPRIPYLSTLAPGRLAYPMVRGTIVHEVFGDLLRGVDRDAAIDRHVAESGLELGLLDRDADAVRAEVETHVTAIESWLDQGRFGTDEWRSERTLLSGHFGLRGRTDAVRNGSPVELKTGRNVAREPRFQDKVQAACYALLLGEGGTDPPATGTLLYTKNATLESGGVDGDTAPAKEFTIGHGLLAFVVRARNELAAAAVTGTVPTGHEADAVCAYCFEQDTCRAIAGRLDRPAKAGSIGDPLPEADRAYVERFRAALEAERRAVHAEFANLWRQSPTERATADDALIGLEPAGRTEREDGTWILRARESADVVSRIRVGDLVLASDGDPVRGTAELGRVEELGETVAVTVDEPLPLRRVDVYPSELSIDRQLSALHDAILTGDRSRRDLLLGRRAPTFHDTTETFVDNNTAQDAAVRRAVTAADLALIHGPPGTGKTHVLARTVRALVDRGDRVLVAAFTNRAVDNAVAAIRDQGVEDVLRIGHPARVDETVRDALLPARGDPETLARQLRAAPAVAATTTACGSRPMREIRTDVAVVDEAAQLTEPGTLLAANRADRVVLVGDHNQLPPVVQSDAAPLERSLFERLIDLHPGAAVGLERQYRMAQRIQAFSAREFYDGRLRPATTAVADRSVADLDGLETAALPSALDDRVTHIDPAGEREGNRNPTEAAAVEDVVAAYLDAGLDPGAIGVIAPFRAQAAAIARRVPAGVAVDTVDRFQGSAREVIVISFVATGTIDEPIFEDRRRMNVALTRARRALVLVGDGRALASDPFYEALLDWAG